MWCKFPYNENFVVFPKKHVGGNRNLIINFAWPNIEIAEKSTEQTLQKRVSTNTTILTTNRRHGSLFGHSHTTVSAEVPNYLDT